MFWQLGPITVFNKTIFNILNTQSNPPNYLQFIGWVYLWAAIFHWITAILNCNVLLNLSHLSVSQISQGATFSNTWPSFPATPLVSTCHGSTSNMASKSSRVSSYLLTPHALKVSWYPSSLPFSCLSLLFFFNLYHKLPILIDKYVAFLRITACQSPSSRPRQWRIGEDSMQPIRLHFP